MVFGELNFATANEKRGFFGKGGSFYFDISLSSIRLKGEDVVTKAIALAYLNMVHFICKLLLPKFI